MPPLSIPSNLAEAARRDPHDRLLDWVAALPGVVAELARRWSLRVGEPFQPGGQTAWVAPAVDAAGRDVVLKVGWRHTEAAHEARGLREWDGHGAVRLHDVHESGETSALLMERCLPGTPLAQVVQGPEQDVVVADLLRRLWREPEPGHPFRSLQVMCDEWAGEFEEKVDRSPGSLDRGMARDGIELFRTLPATADRSVLLCTDLHAENILRAHREPWLVIDPKPHVGDPTYDPLQHLLNSEDRLTADPTGWSRRMADLLDLDADRLLLWLFARCVQESPGWPVLAEVARRIAPR